MSRFYVDAHQGPPIPFGLFSVADITDSNDGAWMQGGEFMPLMCADVGFTGSVCDPASGTNEVQAVATTGAPTGGTYTLTIFGQTTAPIAYNATNADVQTALEGLDAFQPGDVAVTGTTANRVITFGGRYAYEDVPQIAATDIALTGGTAPTVTTSTTTEGSRDTKAPTSLPGVQTFDPFTVYMMPRCAGVNEWKDFQAKVGTVFAGAEQRGVEGGLWTGFTQAGAADTVDGTAQAPKAALAELEQWAAENYNTLPVIHAPRDIVTLLIADGLAEARGNVLKTHLGTPIVAGAGYGKTGPNGTAAVAGTGWMFASGWVGGQRGRMMLNGPYMEPENDNTYVALAERVYALQHDCLLGGIAVTM